MISAIVIGKTSLHRFTYMRSLMEKQLFNVQVTTEEPTALLFQGLKSAGGLN